MLIFWCMGCEGRDAIAPHFLFLFTFLYSLHDGYKRCGLKVAKVGNPTSLATFWQPRGLFCNQKSAVSYLLTALYNFWCICNIGTRSGYVTLYNKRNQEKVIEIKIAHLPMITKIMKIHLFSFNYI